MPFQIRLSELHGVSPEQFGAYVLDHIEKMTAFNMLVGKPRPTANLLIESAIERVQVAGKPDAYIPNYTIVDDSPSSPPPMSIDDMKTFLHSQVLNAEAAAKNKIIPPRKMRHLNIEFNTSWAKPESDRTTEDNEIIASYIELNNKWIAIGNAAALAESQIEDLTEADIGIWQVPEFG